MDHERIDLMFGRELRAHVIQELVTTLDAVVKVDCSLNKVITVLTYPGGHTSHITKVHVDDDLLLYIFLRFVLLVKGFDEGVMWDVIHTFLLNLYPIFN